MQSRCSFSTARHDQVGSDDRWFCLAPRPTGPFIPGRLIADLVSTSKNR